MDTNRIVPDCSNRMLIRDIVRWITDTDVVPLNKKIMERFYRERKNLHGKPCKVIDRTKLNEYIINVFAETMQSRQLEDGSYEAYIMHWLKKLPATVVKIPVLGNIK